MDILLHLLVFCYMLYLIMGLGLACFGIDITSNNSKLYY
jgi:hypothetical protein